MKKTVSSQERLIDETEMNDLATVLNLQFN